MISYRYGVGKGNAAEVTYNTKSRQATILLARGKGERDLNLSALHEVWHLLLADLTAMAEEYRNADRVLTEEHKVIARMENYIKGKAEVVAPKPKVDKRKKR